MQLTELQLQLMEHSDKTLKFWCIVHSKGYMIFLRIQEETVWPREVATCLKYDNTICWVIWFDKENIIWNPFWRGRVCMLFANNYRWKYKNLLKIYNTLVFHFNKNPDLYDQTCLEWDDATQKLVLDFLNSLSINK